MGGELISNHECLNSESPMYFSCAMNLNYRHVFFLFPEYEYIRESDVLCFSKPQWCTPFVICCLHINAFNTDSLKINSGKEGIRHFTHSEVKNHLSK